MDVSYPKNKSSSKNKRTEGGGFSRSQRFPRNCTTSRDTPGAQYDLPTMFSDHLQGHIYKDTSHTPTGANTLPHPSKDRTAWMIGMVKSDLAYYNNIAGHMGPAQYQQSVVPLKPRNPTNVFSKDRRFQGLTNQYVSKEHNQANLCTASPGPKYSPGVSNMDLVSDVRPKYSFRSQGVSNRSVFLNQMVKGGYIYNSKPATGDHATNVGPANYRPDESPTRSLAPRPRWTKADRFADQPKRFISHKHTREKMGTNSPGPIYQPTNHNLSNSKKMATSVPAGKWCP